MLPWAHAAHNAARRLCGRTSLRVVVPLVGQKASPTMEPLFQRAAYGRFALGLLWIQLISFCFWQAEPLQQFLRAHSRCSWVNVVSEGRWWAAVTAHVCHRDFEHLATNLGLLLMPTFLLQCFLSSGAAVSLCLVAAAGSSAASLGYAYYVFAPREARQLGYHPWIEPLFTAVSPAPTCSRGHALRHCAPERSTACAAHKCNACARGIFVGEMMQRCDACDYDICLDCSAKDGLERQPALRFHTFRNAFDEFCFLREAELAVGFDTMTSNQPYITHPHVFQTAPRLDLREADALCQPYHMWWLQASRGSLGSSALASALSAVTALWLAELFVIGWRHPLLLLFPIAASVQPVADLARIAGELQDLKAVSIVVGPGGDADAVGHLAGGGVGAVAYIAARLWRRGRAVPMYPLIPRN